MALNIPRIRLNDRSISGEDLRDGSVDHGERTSTADLSLCEESFRPSVMVKIFSFHWLVSIGIVATGIYLSVYPVDILECNTYYVIVYLQLGFWVGTYMINEFIKPSCRKMAIQNPRLNSKMTSYRKKPLQIVSLWNTALIVTQKYATEKMKISTVPTGSSCDPVEGPPQMFIIFFCGLQTVALTLFYIPALVYLIREMGYDHHPVMQQHAAENGSSRVTTRMFTENLISTAAATRPVPFSLDLSLNRDRVALPSPQSVLQVPMDEQLRTYAQWFQRAQLENDKLWRQAKKLGIKPEDLPPSDRPENHAQ